MHEFKVEAAKFILVGAANFVLTFIVFTVLLKVLSVNYLLSLLAAWFVGMIFSYCMSFLWVFQQPDKLALDHRFAKFAIVGAVSISFNLVGLEFLVRRTNWDPMLAQTVLIPFIVTFNFLFAKFWSFGRVRL